MSPAIQFSGLASGLDTTAIIDAIMAAEQIRVTRLESRRAQINSRQNAINDLKTRLVTLQLKASDLTLASKLNAKKATPADASVLTATASTNAAAGVFTINVKQLATATVATSASPIGSVINAAAALTSAGFATTPTNGTFTVNGKTFTITDVNTATLTGIRDAINTGVDQPGITAAAGAAATASLTTDSGGRADNAFQLASATDDVGIQVGAGGDTSNILSLLKLVGVAPTAAKGGTLAVGQSTAGNEATVTSIDVSGAAAAQQDTYTFSSAAANKLTLTRADGTTQTVDVTDLAQGDTGTYDFSQLGVKVSMKAVSSAGETAADIITLLAGKTTTVSLTTKSQGNLGTALPSEPLTAGRLATALSGSSGSFTINGATITWNDGDSLNGIISRINASAAKVTASYDTVRDAVVLTAKNTGSPLISIADVTGNLMAALNVTSAATQVAGQNAVISIDGGADFSSSGNTITGAVTGVTLDLKKLGTTQVTVVQDADIVVDSVKAFVDQANSALTFISDKTKYDSVAKKAEILLGDSTVRSIETRLVGLLSGPFTGAASTDKYGSLGDLGISFGAVGSGVGTTKTLVLNESKFRDAIAADPTAVEKVFNTFTNTATFTDGTGSITSISGAPTGHHKSGQYVITASGGGGTLASVFTPNGGVAQTGAAGAISAGSSTSTLIAGMTLNSTALSDGTDTIDVSVNTLGVGHLLNDYLKDTLGVSGAFKAREDSTNSQVKSINDQISEAERRLETKRDALVRRFAELEKVLGALKSQQDALSQQLAQLSRK